MTGTSAPSIDTNSSALQGWRSAKLHEVCEIVAGQSPPGSTYRNSPEGLPFFQGKADFGLLHPVPRVWCVAPTKIAVPGDILISVRAPVGPTNIADTKCCIGRGLAAIRCGTQVDRDFVLHALRRFESELAAKGSGSTFDAIGRDDLESITIPLPPLAEQKRIAAILNEQLVAVERARAAAQAQLDDAKALPPSYLRELFPRPGDSTPPGWRTMPLGDVATLLPSRPIASDGDTEVRAVTTASLTEVGFDSNGIKTARMWAADVMQCALSPGEILIARSNTAELVGRASLFPGSEATVVASDLTIRVKPGGELLPGYSAGYLSSVFATGYWRRQAGGASGSMKKITRTQVQELPVPVPPLPEQQDIATLHTRLMGTTAKLQSGLEAQVRDLDALPSSILNQAFCGGL